MKISNLREITEALGRGAVVGLPTDTVYGVAADPSSPSAVARLFSIKQRQEDKPVGLLVADLDTALRIVDLPEYAVRWARSFWPGPLNLVAVTRLELPAGVGDQMKGTVGVRVPDHATAIEILSAFGPLAVTSANPSGGEETLDDASARAALGDLIDLYVVGDCPGGVSSTTVDVSGPDPVLLRKGPLDLGLKFEV
jgi:L-threonylcarbamoyladenylate synthase